MMPDTQAANAGAVNLSANQLRNRYIVALSLIAILTLASQAILQLLIADQKYDARLVNIAGRQRMLSQRITQLAYSLPNTESADAAIRTRKDLEQAVSLWQRSHLGLLRGDGEMGLPGRNSAEVAALFQRIQPHYEAMVAATEALRLTTTKPALLAQSIKDIREHEAGFLKGMDTIVFRLDAEANARVESTRRIEIGLTSVTLLVLLLEAVFIFAPATRRIRRDMQELADRERDMDRLFSVSPTALMLIARDDLRVLRANDKATSLVGFPPEKIAGANLRDFLDQDYEANRGFLEKITRGEILNEYEVVLIDSQRSVFESLVSVRPVCIAGQAVFVLGVTNIAELKKAQQTLQYYATFDELTGLMNRRTGLMMLGKSMARVRRDGGRITLCYIDLDGLKAANDEFGHAEGDWLIHTVADVLTAAVRSSDAAVRVGGDEFMLILHDCSPDEGLRLLARAEARLKEAGAAEHKPFPMSFSYGLTVYEPEKHYSPDQLIAEADGLMYQAKQKKKALRSLSDR